MPETTRQLAAIMFTDIVGYTTLMGESEKKTLEIRRRNKQIHQQVIKDVGGKWLKEVGDGTLASFATITDAVKSAGEIKQICKQELDIDLKIGIHLGDVMYEDGDVFGDGVNIASRIQDLAVGGGILISEPVYKDIKNKEEFKAILIGETALKNVDGQHKIYQILDGELAKPTIKIKTSSKRSKLLGIAAGLIIVLIAAAYFVIWPKLFSTKDTNTSIAVLPFHNPTDDESQKHYGVGMATEIRSKLSQSKHFDFISSMRATMGYGNTDSPIEIGDELEVKYLLSGIYQISGDQIKVDVELIDTESGAAVWVLSFNELFTDIFLLQSKIASKVFNEFGMVDNQDQDLPTQNFDAYGHYLKGMEYWSNIQSKFLYGEADVIEEAINQLNLAIQKDSSFIDPYVTLVNIKSGWVFMKRNNKTVRESEEYVSMITEINNLKDYAETHFSGSWKNKYIKAIIAYHVDLDLDEGLRLFEEVLTYDPENSEAHGFLGAIYKRKLMQREAISLQSISRKLNPGSPGAWTDMSSIFMTMGDYSSAEKAAQNAIDLGSGFRFIQLFLQQGKTYPGAKERNPLYYYHYERFFKRDFTGIIALFDTTKLASAELKYYRKAYTYHLLEIQDSVKFYGQLYLDNMDNPNPKIFAMLGNKEKAINTFRETTELSNANGHDIWASCSDIKDEIELLVILGDYTEATDLLINLNKSYPNYGDYGSFFNWPEFDKIKAEYPPFVEALNNLKIPPKLVLEGIIKL